jgi:hypothetical protein
MISVRAPRRHFSRPLRVLTSGISQIQKNVRILGISGFWHFFQNCEIPLVSTPTGYVKCHSISVHSCADLSERLGGKCGATSYGLRYLQVEFCKSDKIARILWHIFPIYRIPLLSTSKGHAKCFNFFCFSIHCCADLCESTSAGQVAALCIACKGT